MALSSRKRCPTLALHIGARKSSTVSSLFTVCRPDARCRVLRVPQISRPVPHASQTNKLIYADNYVLF